MTTTWELENVALVADTVGINVRPYEGIWAETARESSNGTSTIESRMAGDTPSLPLVRRVTNRPAQVFHPAEGQGKKRAGHVFRVELHSSVAVEDTVLGPMAPEIVQTAVEIKYSGNVILDPDNVLEMLASTLFEVIRNAPSGVLDYTTIERVAVGVVDID